MFHNKGNFLEYLYESMRNVMLMNKMGRNSHLAVPESYSCRIMLLVFFFFFLRGQSQIQNQMFLKKN